MVRILDITTNPIINEDVSQIIEKNIHLIDIHKSYNVLITGANGMLPSYLLYFFQGLSILSDYKITISLIIRSKTDRIDIIKDKRNIHIIGHGVEHPIVKDSKFDFIVHAASDATPSKYLENKINTINANVKGLYNLLELDTTNLKSLLFFSTAELYGNPSQSDIPTKEEVIGLINHVNERSSYVETKRFCETLCMNYFFEKKLPIKIVRPFHTFGPGLDIEDGRVFSDFIKSVLHQENIVINSDGTATRAFCYLADALDMFVKVLFSGKDGEIYNIGNPNNEICIKDLAQLMCKIAQNKIHYTILGKANNLAPNRSCPNIDKGITTLGFNPIYTVEESFQRTLKSLVF